MIDLQLSCETNKNNNFNCQNFILQSLDVLQVITTVSAAVM